MITGIDLVRLPLDLPLQCRCGRVRGVANEVSLSSGFRFICYCKDCQAFARFLERPDVVDPAGGTDIFQMPQGRVKLTTGTDAVRPAAHRRYSAGGCSDSAGRPRSSMIARMPRSPCRACSRGVSVQLFDCAAGLQARWCLCARNSPPFRSAIQRVGGTPQR